MKSHFILIVIVELVYALSACSTQKVTMRKLSLEKGYRMNNIFPKGDVLAQ